MKKLIGAALIIFVLCVPSHALTGLGFGIHAGQSSNYSYDVLNDSLGAIAEILDLSETLKFDDKLTLIGAHIKVGTLPILDFYGFIDYAWKKKSLASDLDLRLSDFSIGADARKKFGSMLIKPYVGVGFAVHKLAYTLETNRTEILLLPPDQSKLGYHILAGVELSLPVFPVAPYAHYKYSWITTKDSATKYGLIEAGFTFSL